MGWAASTSGSRRDRQRTKASVRRRTWGHPSTAPPTTSARRRYAARVCSSSAGAAGTCATNSADIYFARTNPALGWTNRLTWAAPSTAPATSSARHTSRKVATASFISRATAAATTTSTAASSEATRASRHRSRSQSSTLLSMSSDRTSARTAARSSLTQTVQAGWAPRISTQPSRPSAGASWSAPATWVQRSTPLPARAERHCRGMAQPCLRARRRPVARARVTSTTARVSTAKQSATGAESSDSAPLRFRPARNIRRVAVLTTRVDPSSDEARANARQMRALVADLRAKTDAVSERGAAGDERQIARHRERGKLPVRERIDRLLDPGSPFLELSPLAANGMYDDEAPGAGIVTGIGRVSGTDVRHRRQRRDGQGRHLLPDDRQEAPARPGDRAPEPAAVHLPGRLGRRVPAAPGRGLPRPRALRPHLLQPGADERRRASRRSRW